MYDYKFVKTIYALRMNIFHQIWRKQRSKAVTLLDNVVRLGNFNEEAAENKFDANDNLLKFYSFMTVIDVIRAVQRE